MSENGEGHGQDIENINLTVGKGECVLFCCLSGCGESTYLLKAYKTLLVPENSNTTDVPILVVKDLALDYKKNIIKSDINMEVCQGEIFGS